MVRQTMANDGRSPSDGQPDYLRTAERKDYERQMTRKWKAGDVYAPKDLSSREMKKWKTVQKQGRPAKDAVDLLGINPLHHYKVRHRRGKERA